MLGLEEGATLRLVGIESIRMAYDALGRGDVELLVSLMDERMEWRGRHRGWRFWRPVPS